MLMKLTKGKLIDYAIIAAMLSFSLGIALVNFGQYPLVETVSEGNLVATSVYIIFWVLFIYIAHLFRRSRILLFCRIYSSAVLIFTLWFVAASVSANTFIPEGSAHIFSVLTLALNNHYIGIYYFLSPAAGELYACLSFLFVLLNAGLSWLLWLSDVGYFEKLHKAITGRPRKTEKLKEEILQLRQKKRNENAKKSNRGHND